MSSTHVTHSRSASLTASFSVRLPEVTVAHGRAEQLHPEHVERLALGVDLAHEHRALEPEERRGRRRRHAVLAGTGLGDEAALAHPHGEQPLADDVVELVRAGVQEVLALEQDADAELGGEPLARGHRGRPAAEVREHARGAQRGTTGPPRRRAKATASSAQAGTSASGTKRPPNSPNRPSVPAGCATAHR